MRTSSTLLLLCLVCCTLPKDRVADKRYSIPLHDRNFRGEVSLSPTSKGFKIAIHDYHGTESDRVIFPFDYYALDTADVNRDGNTDILIGVVKTTRFDPGEKRRLFILQIDEGRLRPLWLGSKVYQQLLNFKTGQGGVVTTLEKTQKGNFAVGLYQWENFGLVLIQYVVEEKTYEEALDFFNN